MKKKRLTKTAVAVFAALCLSFASCGEGRGDDKETDAASTESLTSAADGGEISGPTFSPELDYNYDLSEYIRLPDHSALTLDVELLTVSEEDIDEVVEDTLSSQGSARQITDRGAAPGDSVTYNVRAVRKDTGEEVDNGSSRTLVIGSDAYLAGFGERLIGVRAGDTVEFEYTYPEDYYTKSVAGVTADFTVTVTVVAEVKPAELTDGFAASLGIEGVTDVSSWRSHIREVMQSNADAENEQKMRDAVYEILDSGAEVLKWPEKEWNHYKGICDKTVDSYSTVNGISREAYIMQTYGSYEAYDAYVEDYCASYVKKDMISYTLAREYGVTVDPAEYERELRFGFERFAAAYRVETLSDFEKMFSLDLSSGLLLAAGLNAVAANARVV